MKIFSKASGFFLLSAGMFISCSKPENKDNTSGSYDPNAHPSEVMGKINLSEDSQYLKNHVIHTVLGAKDPAVIPLAFTGSGDAHDLNITLTNEQMAQGWSLDQTSLASCHKAPHLSSCQVNLNFSPDAVMPKTSTEFDFSYEGDGQLKSGKISFDFETVSREAWNTSIEGLDSGDSKYNSTMAMDDDNNIYVIANQNGNPAPTTKVIALSSDGKTRWQFALPRGTSDVRFTAITVGPIGILYAGTSANTIYKLDTKNGKLVPATPNPIPSDIFETGSITSAASDGMNTYFSTGEQVVALTLYGTVYKYLDTSSWKGRPMAPLSTDRNPKKPLLFVGFSNFLDVYTTKHDTHKVKGLFPMAAGVYAGGNPFTSSAFGDRDHRKILLNSDYQIAFLNDLNKPLESNGQMLPDGVINKMELPSNKPKDSGSSYSTAAAAGLDEKTIYVESTTDGLVSFDISGITDLTKQAQVKWNSLDLNSSIAPLATGSVAGGVILISPEVGTNKCLNFCGIVDGDHQPVIKWNMDHDAMGHVVGTPILSQDGRTAFVRDDQNKIHAINL